MKWFRLFSDIVAVAGDHSCALYNFRDQCIYTLNQNTYHFLEAAKQMPISLLWKSFGKENTQQLINKLCAQHIGFIHAEPEHYIDMPLEWDCSSLIQRAVVDYEDHSFGLAHIAAQLDSVLCESLELRLNVPSADQVFISECLSCFAGTTVRNIHLVVEYKAAKDFLQVLAESCVRLTAVSLCNAPVNGKKMRMGLRIAYHRKSMLVLDRETMKKPLIVQRRFFCEALHFNPYFNRKVVIDNNGFLRNDLHQKEHFGNIKSIDLTHLPSDDSFTELWHACADKVLPLKHDPLRYARFITDIPIRVSKNIFTY